MDLPYSRHNRLSNKNPTSGLGSICWSVGSHGLPKAMQPIVITLGYPPKLDGKTPYI